MIQARRPEQADPPEPQSESSRKQSVSSFYSCRIFSPQTPRPQAFFADASDICMYIPAQPTTRRQSGLCRDYPSEWDILLPCFRVWRVGYLSGGNMIPHEHHI